MWGHMQIDLLNQFLPKQGNFSPSKKVSDTETSEQNLLSETQTLLSQRALPQRLFTELFYLIPQHS